MCIIEKCSVFQQYVKFEKYPDFKNKSYLKRFGIISICRGDIMLRIYLLEYFRIEKIIGREKETERNVHENVEKKNELSRPAR